MISKSIILNSISILLAIVMIIECSQAKSITTTNNNNEEDSVSAVIPSPNQEFGYNFEDDIVRQPAAAVAATTTTNGLHSTQSAVAPTSSSSLLLKDEEAVDASNEALVPIYVSPYLRAERPQLGAAASIVGPSFDPQESSHAPLNYAPRPSASLHLSAPTTKDLKTSASYGHHHGHHGGHYGYDHSGWLDMGAWTGGKGSFGWYADYPVGGKHHGYGRKFAILPY